MSNPVIAAARESVRFQSILDHQACDQIVVADQVFDSSQRAPVPPVTSARFAARDLVVATVLARVAAGMSRYGDVARIDPALSVEHAAARTLDALRHPDGTVAVLGGVLVGAQTSGRPALLVAADPHQPALGWVPVQVKLGSVFEGEAVPSSRHVSSVEDPTPASATTRPGTRPKRRHALQLAHYNALLEELDIPGPVLGGAIGTVAAPPPVGVGCDDMVVVWHRLDDPIYRDAAGRRASARRLYGDLLVTYLTDRGELAQRAGTGQNIEIDPQRREHCGQCCWRTACRDLRTARGEITQLPEVTIARAAVHRAVGVNTIGQLAALSPAVAAKIDRSEDLTPYDRHPQRGHPATARYRDQSPRPFSRPVFARSIDQARVTVAGTPHLARGVRHLDLPAGFGPDVFLDVETTRHRSLFLAGLHLVPPARRPTTVVLENWDGPQAAAALADAVWDQLDAWERRHGLLTVWHYGRYDPDQLLPTHPERRGFVTQRFVDLHRVVREQLVMPTEDYGLKAVASWFGATWSDPDADGELALWLHDKAVAPAVDEYTRRSLRTRLVAYNHDDVLALACLHAALADMSFPLVESLDADYGSAV